MALLDRARLAGCASPRWPHMGVRDSRGHHRDRGADPDRQLRVPITTGARWRPSAPSRTGGRGRKSTMAVSGLLIAPARPTRRHPFAKALSGPTSCPARQNVRTWDGRSRRIAPVADCDRERRKWASKRTLPTDTYRHGLRPKHPIHRSPSKPSRRAALRPSLERTL